MPSSSTDPEAHANENVFSTDVYVLPEALHRGASSKKRSSRVT